MILVMGWSGVEFRSTAIGTDGTVCIRLTSCTLSNEWSVARFPIGRLSDCLIYTFSLRSCFIPLALDRAQMRVVVVYFLIMNIVCLLFCYCVRTFAYLGCERRPLCYVAVTGDDYTDKGLIFTWQLTEYKILVACAVVFILLRMYDACID